MFNTSAKNSTITLISGEGRLERLGVRLERETFRESVMLLSMSVVVASFIFLTEKNGFSCVHACWLGNQTTRLTYPCPETSGTCTTEACTTDLPKSCQNVEQKCQENITKIDFKMANQVCPLPEIAKNVFLTTGALVALAIWRYLQTIWVYYSHEDIQQILQGDPEPESLHANRKRYFTQNVLGIFFSFIVLYLLSWYFTFETWISCSPKAMGPEYLKEFKCFNPSAVRLQAAVYIQIVIFSLLLVYFTVCCCSSKSINDALVASSKHKQAKSKPEGERDQQPPIHNGVSSQHIYNIVSDEANISVYH